MRGKVKKEKLHIRTQPVGRETSLQMAAALFGSEAAIVWCHCKWHLTDKRSQRSWENHHLHVTPQNSLMYKRIQWAEIRWYCVKAKTIPLRVRGLQRMEKKNWKKKKAKSEKCQGRFVRLCTAHTFYSPVPFANVCLCRTLAVAIHCITVYIQPPPSLHRQHGVHCYWFLLLESFSIGGVWELNQMPI